MRTAHWGDQSWPIVDDGLSVTDIQNSLVHIDAAISDATPRGAGSDIFFELPVAQKG